MAIVDGKVVAPLSTPWINERAKNVMEMVMKLVDRLEARVIETGHLPLEDPLTPFVLARMTPDQFAVMRSAAPTPEDQAELDEMFKNLDTTSPDVVLSEGE